MTTIAEVLHRAADKWLWDGINSFHREGRWLRIYSCDAVIDAAMEKNFDETVILDGLMAMGCNVASCGLFDDLFSTDRQRQGARYLWLKWAALMAEEEGV